MKVPFSYLTLEAQARKLLIDDIFAEMRQVVEKGDFTLGEQVAEVEETFAKVVGGQYAVAVRSGTDALYLTLWALGVGPGDIVAMPANTHYATAGAVCQIGARPAFSDVSDDPEDMFLLPSEGKTRPRFPLSEKVKAVIPVCWGGDVPGYPMHRIPLVRTQDADQKTPAIYATPFVILDAAQAVGATYKGIPLGSMGTAACFSFHPLKNIHAWGDAGMVTTTSLPLAARIRALRNHGLLDRDNCLEPGMNGRMETMQAVVIKHFMKVLPEVLEKRRKLARLYDEGLATIKGVRVPARSQLVGHTYHLFQIQAERRDALQTFLRQHEVETKVHYPKPLYLQPAFRQFGEMGGCPVTEMQSRYILSLPCHEYMEMPEVEFVVGRVREFYQRNG